MHPERREVNRRDCPSEVKDNTHIDFNLSGFILKSNHSAQDMQALSSNEMIKGSSKPQWFSFRKEGYSHRGCE